MEYSPTNKEISNYLKTIFLDFGIEFGFRLHSVQESRYATAIYLNLDNNYALELEIDWREYYVFMYIVHLRNNQIPPADVIYSYSDGQWCRKYIEEIYRTKRPMLHKQIRYQPGFLFSSLEYCISIIRNNPSVLTDFCAISSDCR